MLSAGFSPFLSVFKLLRESPRQNSRVPIPRGSLDLQGEAALQGASPPPPPAPVSPFLNESWEGAGRAAVAPHQGCVAAAASSARRSHAAGAVTTG